MQKISLEKAIEKFKNKRNELQEDINRVEDYVNTLEDEEWIETIDTVLEELNDRIPKDDLKNILRKVQDYQLNYKDTVLFNIIMQEIFGETEWTNLEDKE